MPFFLQRITFRIRSSKQFNLTGLNFDRLAFCR